MTERQLIDQLLCVLGRDIPALSRNMRSFSRAFEARAKMILGVSHGDNVEYVIDCLMVMLRKSGITQRDGYRGPTLH